MRRYSVMGVVRRWDRGQLRELAWLVGPLVLVVAGAFWLASQFVAPPPPRTMTIAAASVGSPYYQAALRYRQELAASGIELKIFETKGSLDNLALIKDPNSGVDAAFVQGGLTGGTDTAGLRSIGRMFYEPVWLFYAGWSRLDKLSALAGKRVLIGPAGSGTAALAIRLLAASGITAGTATLINMELPDYVEALTQGKADAGVLVLGAEARTVRRLFDSPGVHLMNLVQADAYAQRFPYLQALDLKEGVVDFARDVPPADTRMLATSAALVIRDGVHPALASLLTQAAIAVHGVPRLDAGGATALFSRAGQFPSADDQEFPLSPEAARVYKSGPPFLQRYLPFWLATALDRLVVVLLPVLGILLPVVRFAPVLYVWRMRQRLFYWYRELMAVEFGIGRHSSSEEIAAALQDLERINAAVNRLPIPSGFANQLYDLRDHLDAARARLAALRT